MTKSYTWKEIKSFLEKELKKTKTIMTFGTIGSCNVENDVDVIITKKPQAKSSSFFKEIHILLDKLDNYLKKKYLGRLIRVPSTSYTEEFMELANYSSQDFVLHALVYSSYPQMKKDWDWALFGGENLKQMLNKSYSCFFGKKEELFSKNFQKSLYAENIFLYVQLYDRTNSNYSNFLLLKVMNHYLDFLYRKRLNLKTPIIKNKKDIRKSIYRLGDILDKLNKNH